MRAGVSSLQFAKEGFSHAEALRPTPGLFTPRPRVSLTPPGDASQLKGFASAALGSDAQQTVQWGGGGRWSCKRGQWLIN